MSCSITGWGKKNASESQDDDILHKSVETVNYRPCVSQRLRNLFLPLQGERTFCYDLMCILCASSPQDVALLQHWESSWGKVIFYPTIAFFFFLNPNLQWFTAGRFIVFSNVSNLSSAFSPRTKLKGDICHWVFNAQQHHVFAVRVKIILIWWHLLLLWASVGSWKTNVPVFFPLFFYYFFSFMRRALCCSCRTTMTRSDRSNWGSSPC